MANGNGHSAVLANASSLLGTTVYEVVLVIKFVSLGGCDEMPQRWRGV